MANKYVSKKELWMYSIGGLGQGMVYAIMSQFISDYYTNVLMLSHGFVFTLMLLPRIWDAINDPLMGIIVDRHTLRRGKFKPYILYTAVPIAILTLLMYWCPGVTGASAGATIQFSGSLQQSVLGFIRSPKILMVYCTVVYVLWGMIYTMSDVPFWSLPNAMTGDAEERGHVISFSRIFNGIGSAVPTVIFMILGFIFVTDGMGKVEETAVFQKKYLIMALIASVIGIALFVNSYFHVKERIGVVSKPRQEGDPGSLSRIFRCKPLMLVIAMGILSSGRYLMSAAAVHVSRYAFDASATGVFTVLQICSAGGMFGAMLFMPALMKKYDYKKIVIVTCLAGAVASLVTTLVGWKTQNFYVCAPFILLQCIPLGVINTVSYAMIGDCLDYMELTTGYRDTALGSSCQGFVNKLGNSLATAGISLMYIYIGLNPADALATDAVVSAATLAPKQRFGMFSLISVVPGVCLLLCAIPMFFYKIAGPYKKEMVEQLAQRREAALSAKE